ncbi:hypothetical protein A2U01_0087726, partial [Trifolium medium]|nr:hypothetical protein [Trifolium medium]
HSEPADQGKKDDNDVVNVDDLKSEEKSVEKTPAPTIAKRLRSQSGKDVASVITSAKPTKSTKNKGLKRKAVESSDSDFEETIAV